MKVKDSKSILVDKFRIEYDKYRYYMLTEFNDDIPEQSDDDLITIALIHSIDKFKKLNKKNGGL